MTLYDDGKDFEHDSGLVNLLVKLLEHNLNVCVVTAAGYPGDASRYEERLSGLLKGFENARLSKNICEKFFVLGELINKILRFLIGLKLLIAYSFIGGECNYLFQCQADYHLKYLPEA